MLGAVSNRELMTLRHSTSRLNLAMRFFVQELIEDTDFPIFVCQVCVFPFGCILSQIESGDPSAAAQLLPLVYEKLRKMAAAKMAHEQPGQTLQATALVHEAYLRLVDQDRPRQEPLLSIRS